MTSYAFLSLIIILQLSNTEIPADILSQRTTDINVKKMFIKKMESMGALEYTLNKIRELDKECTRLINEIGYNEPLDRVLDILRKV